MLSILIWLPAAAAMIGAITGGERAGGGFTLLGSVGSLAIAIALIVGYHGNLGEITHITDVMWIRSLGIHYKIGVDGLNLFLRRDDDAASSRPRCSPATCARGRSPASSTC